MALFGLFSKKPKHEFSLILDIGSASVGAAIVELDPNQKPKLHRTVRVPIALSEKPTFDVFLPKLLAFLDKALELSLKDVKKRTIKHAYCFYASPWYSAETKRAHITEKQPVEITQDFLDDLLAKQEQEFLGKTKMMNESDGLHVSEKKVLDVRLNGYKTSDPFGKVATDIDMSLFLSVIPEQVVAGVEDMIDRYVHTKDIYHHSFPLASYSSVLDVFPHDNTFMLADITGEVTDIYLVREDVLEAIHSFPSGRNLLIRKIAENFDVSVSGAVSYLNMYMSGDAEAQFAEQMRTTVSAVQQEWDIYCKNGIAELCGNDPAPDKVFLMVDDDVTTLFTDLIKQHERNFVVLDRESLKEFVDAPAVTDEDPFLVLESLFVNKLYRE